MRLRRFVSGKLQLKVAQFEGSTSEGLQSLRLADIHAAILTFPDVNSGLAYTVLPGHIDHLLPRFLLLQYPDNLLFVEPALLHCSFSFVAVLADAENLNYGWLELSRAGQDSLIYAARTRNRFTPASRLELFQKLKPLETTECPLSNLPEAKSGRWGAGLTAAKMKDCRWLKPEIVGQFEFVE